MLGALICAGFAIKVNIRGKEYAQEATQYYNNSLKTSYHLRPERQIFLRASNEGIGLQVRF